MLGISAIYFLDLKGRVLINRHYRGQLPADIFDRFNVKLLEFDENTMKPVIQDESYFYFHRRFNNIILLAICEHNVNSVMVFCFIGFEYDIRYFDSEPDLIPEEFGRRKCKGQFRDYLRAAGWDDGQWLPLDYGV